MRLTRRFLFALILIFVLSFFEQVKIDPIPEASFLRVKVREKGLLKRAASVAGRLIFGVNTEKKEPPLNTEKLPVGMFPDPKELAQELDMLENRKIIPDSNRQSGVEYVTDILNGETPNLELLSNSQMAQINSGAIEKGPQELQGAFNKTKMLEVKANKEKEQALQSQGQIIKEGDKIKIGNPGPVTLDDPDENKKGKTVPPKLAVVDDEENFASKNANMSIFSNPFVIISIFSIIVCAFAGGGLIYFKKWGNKKRRKGSV